MPPSTTYFIATKTALKALNATQRAEGYTRATVVNNQPVWYGWISTSTATADDDQVLMPNDNPVTGRWHKYSGSGADTAPGGQPWCFNNCANGGYKVWEFFAGYTNLVIVVKIGFNFSGIIATGSNSIKICGWDNTPDEALTYLDTSVPVATLPHTGGVVVIPNIDASNRYYSIVYEDASSSLIASCFVVNGNVFTMVY